MRLSHGIHLGYCTNIHRGETWPQTLASLEQHTARVRKSVCAHRPYGVGLRLSALAAAQLSEPVEMDRLRAWLDRENAYVFTINGFPYGKFHGTPVKEQVYAPDWSRPERLAYTCLLFDLLARLLPDGCSGSVSTLPGSFKEFGQDQARMDAIVDNLLLCHTHIERLRQQTGRDLHLGLEPEPLGLLETTPETIRFFEKLTRASTDASSLLQNIGVNYDTCHQAVEFEDAGDSLNRLTAAGLRLSKMHLSSALALTPDARALRRLSEFQDEVYLHQVVDRSAEGDLHRFRDLDAALGAVQRGDHTPGEEWRVHFHIPLDTAPLPPFRDTRDHLESALDWLQQTPSRCQHLEMETYTWEVLPSALRSGDVAGQLIREYQWTLDALQARNLA